jgi:hypothetical protein
MTYTTIEQVDRERTSDTRFREPSLRLGPSGFNR